MGKPAARITDMHTCPMVTPGLPPIPHVGGPVTGPGVPTVLIGGMPAAVMGDMCVCVGPPDTIIMGSTGVFIGGKPAARMGDPTVHGGVITVGCPTVLIGEVSPGSPVPPVTPLPVKAAISQMGSSASAKAGQVITLKSAAKSGVPFVEKCTGSTSQTSNTPSNDNASQSKPIKSIAPIPVGKTAIPVTAPVKPIQANMNEKAPPTWDSWTNTAIAKLDPRLQENVKKFINAVDKELGIQLRIPYDGNLRTFEEQDALYAKGRTAPGDIVTYAEGGESYHNYGLAFDVVIIKNKKVGGAITPDIGEIGERYGFDWGGRWPTQKEKKTKTKEELEVLSKNGKGFDRPHFQNTQGQTINQLINSK